MDEAADLLQSVVEGSVEAADAAKRLWMLGQQIPALEAVAANFEHYIADADIRAKDTAYKAFQEAELRKLIEALSQGAEPSRLRRINFLQEA